MIYIDEYMKCRTVKELGRKVRKDIISVSGSDSGSLRDIENAAKKVAKANGWRVVGSMC